MKEFHISVRALVEFVLRDGDLDNRRRSDVRTAMLEGGRIHRIIQKRQKAGYQAEVPLSLTVPLGDYSLIVEGRADGIIGKDTGEVSDGQMRLSDLLPASGADADKADEWKNAPLVDEIKGTYEDVAAMREAKTLHKAQAMCYAYFLACRDELARVIVRLTYCNMETMEIRYFRYRYTFRELKAFFDQLIDGYRPFSDYLYVRRQQKLKSIEALTFPFAYRAGQKKVVGYVYRTIAAGRKLFLEAPTGAGKTLAVIYPALKALAEERAERLFYMTAKTIARTAPEQAFAILREQGLRFKTLTLTSKERICILDHPDCNPVACPRARGHLGRVNAAILELLYAEEHLGREQILACAEKHAVCPFELSLDLALFADGVICDYNYVFDPFVYLRRFFGEGAGGDNLFLVDEAHNLLDRGRDMYSARLSFSEIEAAAGACDAFYAGHREWQTEAKKLKDHFDKAARALAALAPDAAPGTLVPLTSTGNLETALNALMEDLSGVLSEEDRDFDDSVTSFYFALYRFLTLAEGADDHYLVCASRDPLREGAKNERTGEPEATGTALRRTGLDTQVRLMCVDPSRMLQNCMDRAVSTILFSATFLPIQYYKSLLGGQPEDYEAYAETSFKREQSGVFLAGDVTTRYRDRGEAQYRRAARYLAEVLEARKGKYLVFFPSYRMLRAVYDAFAGEYEDAAKVRVLLQQEQMTEEAREEFLSWFTEGTENELPADIRMPVEIEEEESVLGFCVLGGIFGEGIDLKGERLVGVIVMGTGLPQVSGELELMREYFDGHGRDGFDYAYRFPGMNRVLQALGRLIRTETDQGILLLLDERFRQPAYRQLFPKEWGECKIVTTDSVKNELISFWERLEAK